MVPAGDTPKATRRRVRAFVVTSLVVLAVVGFWPIKGYLIDNETFVEALGFPRLRAAVHPPVGDSFRDSYQDGPMADIFDAVSYETSRESREYFVAGLDSGMSHEPVEPDLWLDVHSYLSGNPTQLWVFCRWRNLQFRIIIDSSPKPGGKTDEGIAREYLTAVLDGIDREIPGVTSFYNPPARQLWYDRGKPAFEKIEEWFRELFAP